LEETFGNFDQRWDIRDVPSGEGAVVVIPAEYNATHIDKLNDDLALLPWVVLVLASDERGLFPVEDLRPHPSLKLWVMTPHFEAHEFPIGTQFIGEFYPQDARQRIAQFKYHALDRDHDCSFSGQITHQRRHEMVEALEPLGYYLNKTQGFTQGLSRDDYYELLSVTRCTPAPSGPATLSSFRAFEALESGGVPILDLVCPTAQDGILYWESVLGQDHPLPTVFHWSEAQRWIEDVAMRWPDSGTQVFSWWQMYKRETRNRLFEGIPGYDFGDLTILIPTSPIPSNPSTSILDETIASVRFHFPEADIIIMCDGVRAEQEGSRAEHYAWYLQEVCWKANFEWKNVYPLVFADHQHQANMTRVALDLVRTPLIMFVEHDTPLVTDEPFDWLNIIDLCKSDDIDILRFHFEAHVHPEHESMMIDKKVFTMHGVPVRRTVQWSQRPHIAKREYYANILAQYFPHTGRTMIEDKMHSVAQQCPDSHRIAIYHPGNKNIKRSLHTDGRGTDEKFPMKYE
jgi:hypothetical protein